MFRYLLGRVGQALAVLALTFTAAFLLLQVLPGDAIMIKFMSPEMGLTADQIAEIRASYGADQPLWERYFTTDGNFLTGKFGFSIQAGVPVRVEALATLSAIVLGATTMAVFRGHFKLIRPHAGTMVREAIGGGLMAVGAVLIPGGNDALLVYGLPSGSPHAVVAYVLIAVMVVGLLRGVRVARTWVIWPMP